MSPIDDDATLGSTVCVVGTGVLGLLAVKNLTEQGLEVTAFERNGYVGGNWHMTDDAEQVSVLRQTTSNTSKQMSSFTDYPMPRDYPTFPSAKQLELYLENYASAFNLKGNILFNTAVQSARRDESDKRWLISTRSLQTGEEKVHQFDRLVLATGTLNTKHVPHIEGLDEFAGEAIHSRAFKNPANYKGKNVLIVGIGSTGADTACFLKDAGANNVYVSHRSSFCVLPRMIKGQSFDHSMTRRQNIILRFIACLAPRLASTLMGKGMRSIMNKAFPFLAPHPSFAASRVVESPLHRLPLISETLPYQLRDGSIEAVSGISKVSGPRSVLLTNGRELTDLDAIIICSGYFYDFSIIEGRGDPSDPSQAPDNFDQLRSAPFRNPQDSYPRLYHGILSERYPESLAILGHFLMMKPAFVVNDLATMAIASMWTGKAPLPTREEMKRDLEKHYNFVVQTLQRGPMPRLGLRVDCVEVYNWLNRTAGTGVIERMGWGWEGWSFWWRDRKLRKLLMDGPDLPAVYRLFDTGKGRVPWSDAKAEIVEVNDEVTAMGREWEENEVKRSA